MTAPCVPCRAAPVTTTTTHTTTPCGTTSEQILPANKSGMRWPTVEEQFEAFPDLLAIQQRWSRRHLFAFLTHPAPHEHPEFESLLISWRLMMGRSPKHRLPSIREDEPHAFSETCPSDCVCVKVLKSQERKKLRATKRAALAEKPRRRILRWPFPICGSTSCKLSPSPKACTPSSKSLSFHSCNSSFNDCT